MADQNARTTALEERTTALEAADHLAESAVELTKEIGRLRRRYRLTMVLVALVAVSLLSGIRINYDAGIRQCRSGNEIRAEHNDKWDAITVFLRDAGTGDDEEGRAFLALIDVDLPLKDCSEINWLGN